MFLIYLLLLLSLTPVQCTVTVIIDCSKIVHTVDTKFISFTIDAGEIVAGYAVNKLDSNRMKVLTKALSPAYLRLSGGSADSVGYNVTTTPQQQPPLTTCVGSDCGNCDIANSKEGPPPSKMPVTMSPPFGSGYFNLSTWRRINKFASSTNIEIIFGLNSKAREYSNTPWDGRYGMKELIQWTHNQSFHDFPVVGYELGNEPDLFCRGNTTILPKRMLLDFIQLRTTLTNLPSLPSTERKKKYLLLGPDTAGIGIVTGSCTGNPNAIYNHYYKQFVGNYSEEGNQVLDEVTFHQYYFKGPSVTPFNITKFINVTVMDTLLPKIQLALGPKNGKNKYTTALGETSSAYDGGTPNISSTFASTFTWLDKLGLSSRFGLARVFRQQLCCGGAYDLLGNAGTNPRPDYYATLLWKQLMSGKVLSVKGDDQKGRMFRAYSQCAKQYSGGLAVVYLNMNRNDSVLVNFDSLSARKFNNSSSFLGESDKRMEVYMLSTVEKVFTGHRTTLNGMELLFGEDDVLPSLMPKVVNGGKEGMLVVEPLTVGFVVFPNANVSVCE
jgi:heparanase